MKYVAALVLALAITLALALAAWSVDKCIHNTVSVAVMQVRIDQLEREKKEMQARLGQFESWANEVTRWVQSQTKPFNPLIDGGEIGK